jgi:nitrous oxidase accessory protein NosD
MFRALGLLTLTAPIALSGIASSFPAQDPAPEISLTPGLVIDRSVRIKPGRYAIDASADLTKPAIIVRGTGITIDFQKAVLAGGPDGADPDTYKGVGILIDGGSKVTIQNAVVRGYKVGILGKTSPDLHLTRNDLSYNWKQRLYSGIEKESLVDWMSYHQNEKDEWLRFGAGIYLTDCDRAEIDHNTIVQGQNGLMVTRSSGLKIWNNTIQFLSSIGVGLYRVTGSTIMHNRIDWCVRGYSHGYYNRGQDSAGLLMYEQSSKNIVAYNSITHSGDGLFLWAGQSTMDTGQGGANDNLFVQNDFSHAPTNGIEATFSRNEFYENRVDDCWHGVWGGYSFDSIWMGNRFAQNAEAIAIEHGQNNKIIGNTFDGDVTGVRLWQNATQDPSWGYAKYRDTRSHGYRINGNTFRRNKIAVSVRDSVDVRMLLNAFEYVGETLTLAGETPSVGFEPAPKSPVIDFGSLIGARKLPGGMDPMLRPQQRRGREFIIVDEWGPYDWEHPKLWPVLEADGSTPLPYSPAPGPTPTVRNSRLRVLGPAGSWTLVSVRGATTSASSGQVGEVVAVTPASVSGLIDWQVDLDYRGNHPLRSPRGVWSPPGAPYRFSYRRFVLPIPWNVRFFEYTDVTDPLKSPEAFAKLLAGTPVKTTTVERLDYLSGRPLDEGLRRDRFAMLAEGIAELPAGEYTLQLIADDGARVWVDGELVIDAWAPHESRVDTASIRGGKRRLRVEYYEIGGFAELRLDIQPRR